MLWAAKRIGTSLLLVWLVITLVFLAIHLVPGDPAELLLSQGGAAPDPDSVAQLQEQLGSTGRCWSNMRAICGASRAAILASRCRTKRPSPIPSRTDCPGRWS